MVLKADSWGDGSVVVVVVVRRARRGRRNVGGRWEDWDKDWSSIRPRGELIMLRDIVK